MLLIEDDKEDQKFWEPICSSSFNSAKVEHLGFGRVRISLMTETEIVEIKCLPDYSLVMSRNS